MDAPVRQVAPLFIHAGSGRWTPAIDLLSVAFGSSAWPSANRAIYWPVRIPCTYPVKRVYAVNGSTLSGNWDFGIFSFRSLAKIYSTGSTAQSGASAPQYVTADFTLEPGLYFFGMSASTVSATFQRMSLGTEIGRASGMFSENTAFTLPDLATPATLASGYLPIAGITTTDSGY